jgi:shikimate dehydrogenase
MSINDKNNRLNDRIKIFFSISSAASTNGTFFYNKLFSIKNINAVYIGVQTESLRDFSRAVNFLMVSGGAVARPFKKRIIPFVNELTEIARLTQSVNTIRYLDDRTSIGHNTDEHGLRLVLGKFLLKLGRAPKIVVYGAGGVVPSIVFAIRVLAPDADITCSARDLVSAKSMANKYKLKLSKEKSFTEVDLFINATPATITEPDKILKLTENAYAIFDMMPIHQEYSFEKIISSRNQIFLRGFEMYKFQFIEQFFFLTDVRLTEKEFNRVSTLQRSLG